MTELLKCILDDEHYPILSICNTKVIYMNNYHISLSEYIASTYMKNIKIYDFVILNQAKNFIDELIKSEIFYLKKCTLAPNAFIYYKFHNLIYIEQLNCYDDNGFKQYIRMSKLLQLK